MDCQLRLPVDPVRSTTLPPRLWLTLTGTLPPLTPLMSQVSLAWLTLLPCIVVSSALCGTRLCQTQMPPLKEGTQSQRMKARLMVLFEKRNDNNGDYNLAELLVHRLENLLTEMNSVICSQLADPYDYTSLFTRLDVDHLISMAFPRPSPYIRFVYNYTDWFGFLLHPSRRS